MKKIIFIIGVGMLPWFANAEVNSPPELIVAMVETLLDATEENDLEKFESVCDSVMKAAMTPDVLAGVHAQVSGLMKEGYTKFFMGVLNKGEFKTYYWKIKFKTEGAKDVLAELSVKGDETVGFYLR